jgi:hypothetical protein
MDRALDLLWLVGGTVAAISDRSVTGSGGILPAGSAAFLHSLSSGLAQRWPRFLACSFPDFFVGPVFVGPVDVPGFTTLMIWVPMGEPRPVQASHLGPALKAPLLPEVMSLNADLDLTA